MKKKSYVGIVLRKELREHFRDRKTLILGLVMPALLFPLLFTLMNNGIAGVQKEAVSNTVIALTGAANSGDVAAELSATVFAGFDGISLTQRDDALTALEKGEVKLVISMDEAASQLFLSGSQAKVDLYYNSTRSDSQASLSVVQAALDSYNSRAVREIFKEKTGQEMEEFQPLSVTVTEYTSTGAEAAGGSPFLAMIVPMMLVILVAMGGMASAVDMFAGEKERKTMEPLLTTHAGRGAILTGKYLAVSVMGTLSTILMLGGMIAGYSMNPEMLGIESGDGFTLGLPIPAVVLCLLLVIVVELSFVGIHVCLSSYARNVKEASTYGTIVMLAGMIPAYATMFMQSGDIADKQWMMYVPMLNIVGALKMLLGGAIQYNMVYISLAVSVVFLLAVLVFTGRMFKKESIMLRM